MGYYNNTGRIIPMAAQTRIIPDGAPLQLEFITNDSKHASKLLTPKHRLNLKKVHGLQLFGIQREGQTEL